MREGYNPFMPAYPHIEKYHADLERFIEFGGSDNEQSIRRAFAECLDSYCRDHREKLALVDELGATLRNKPDGTVKDSLRMARGYWEAKDSHDNLDAEIQAKFNRGYPRNNIIFEDSQTAVLVQNASEAMRVNMSRGEDPASPHPDLLGRRGGQPGLPRARGVGHAEVEIDGAVLMLADALPLEYPPTSSLSTSTSPTATPSTPRRWPPEPPPSPSPPTSSTAIAWPASPTPTATSGPSPPTSKTSPPTRSPSASRPMGEG